MSQMLRLQKKYYGKLISITDPDRVLIPEFKGTLGVITEVEQSSAGGSIWYTIYPQYRGKNIYLIYNEFEIVG